jgi:hypothetical protein
MSGRDFMRGTEWSVRGGGARDATSMRSAYVLELLSLEGMLTLRRVHLSSVERAELQQRRRDVIALMSKLDAEA